MLPNDRKKWLCQEEARISKYQHQHRGMSFQKLLLPPFARREVNLVGRDNNIYRGSIRSVPEDELPPEVDEKSIDEEALYKEIRDMNFPPVLEQEPLGPSRRIEGKYTLARSMMLAPVHVDCTEGLEEILVLGKDGGIYRSKIEYPSKQALDKKLGQTKKPIPKVTKTSSTGEYLEPSLVLLHTSEKPVLYAKGKISSIEMPTAEIENIVLMAKDKSIKWKSEIMPDTTDQNETTEFKKGELQSEDDKASEKSEETDTGESAETEKSSEEGDKQGGTEESSEDDKTSQKSEETDTEESAETEKSSEEGDKQGGAEESSEEPNSEASEPVESTESEKSSDTKIAVESDAEASENDYIKQSLEADEPETEEIAKESDTE